jgi:hypothetical protein
MHDPKFEKEVQQRMEELEFSPSEAVWMNLERGLHKQKRRRAPMLWLVFLLGGMILGAGGASLFYFNRPSSSSRLGAAGSPAVAKTAVATVSPVAPAMANKPIVRGSRATAKTAMATGSTATANTTNDRANTAIEKGRSAVTRTVVTRAFVTRTVASRALTPAKTAVIGSIRQTGGNEKLTGGNDWDIASSLGRIGLSSSGAGLDLRGLNNSAKKQLPAPEAAMANKRGAKKLQLSRTPSWEAGFAGGGGLSSAVLSETPAIHPQTSFLTPPSLSLASSLQQSAFAAGHPQLRFSKIQPDVSFLAGIFIQRPVLKKLSVTFGLNLHYYSTRLETGQKAPDSVNTNRASLFYPTTAYAAQPAQNAPYYTSENYKYSNRYYFLEIPISVQWQFNRSRKTPLFWEGGLSYSRLVSANALYYNEKSGVYYKDGGAASPNHLMAFSSLMIGMSWRGNLIRLGPEGQYGLSSLVNANNATSQHLFYGGLKVIVIPRKW